MAASATTGLTADALAIIDLRYLTQSELLALSMCSASSNSANYSNGLNDDKDYSVPKIDRSVFNESAGSRKQTYSRLRLAPRKPEIVNSRSNHRIVKAARVGKEEDADEEGDLENRRIVAMVRELIGDGSGEDEVFEGLVEARVVCDPEMEMEDVETARLEVKVEIGAVSPVRRKRGRPRKDSDVNVSKIMLYDGDMDGVEDDEFIGVNGNGSRRNVDDDKELMNRNGEVVDLEKLGNVDDPFREELSRRTEGMGTKEELLEFLNGLEGQWVSRRRKRKIVDAAGFGDALPLGWKLLFSIKKKAGLAWLICRIYISPSGRQFVSCKDVSSYLRSLCGMQEEDQQISVLDDASITPVEKTPLENVGNHAFKNEAVQNPLAPPSQTPIHVTPVVPENEIASPEKLPNDDFPQLPPSSPKNKLKRRRGALVSDGVIIKDGKYECQFCHKQFEERRRYNGHVGSHVRGMATSENRPKGTDPASTGGGTAIISGMDMPSPSHYSSLENHHDAKSYDNINSKVRPTNFDGSSRVGNFTEKDDIGTSENMEHNANDEAVVGKPYEDSYGEGKLTDELVENDDNSVIYGAEMYSSAMAEAKSLENETNEVYRGSRSSASLVKPVGEDRSSENSTVVYNLPRRESEVVDKSIYVSTRFEKDLKNDIDIGSIQPIACTEKTSFTESNANGLITQVDTEHTIDFTEQFGTGRSPFSLGLVNNSPEDVCAFYRQETIGKSPVSPFPTEQQRSSANGENGMVASNVMEYKVQNPYDGNLPSLVSDKPAFMLDKYLDGISVSSSKPIFMDVNNPEIQHPVVPASNHAIPNENEWSRDAPQKIFGVTYHSSSLNQNLDVNNVEAAPTDVPSATSPWKNFNLNPQNPANSTPGASSGMASKEFWKAVDDPANNVAKIVNEASLNTDVISSLGQRKSSSAYPFSSLGSDQGFSIRNDLAVIGNPPTQERRQEPDIFRGFNPFEREQSHNTKMFPTRPMGQSSIDEVRFPLSSELKISLGNNQSRLDVDAVSNNLKGRSLVLSGNEHFGLQTNTNAFYSGSMEEPRNQSTHGHERGLLDQFGQGQFFGLQNNLNQAYSGPVWGGNRLGPAGSFVPNDLMTGFNDGQTQPTENVMTEANWRGATTHGLAEGSMSREQPSSYPHNYQMMPNKVGDQFFGINLGDIQDQRGSLQHREYNFLNAQAKRYSQETNVLPYESQMQQTYDSSSWLGRPAAFPQAQAGNQSTASCVWCSDVFYLESSFSQADNIVPQCPSCKSKMSQQLNLF